MNEGAKWRRSDRRQRVDLCGRKEALRLKGEGSDRDRISGDGIAVAATERGLSAAC